MAEVIAVLLVAFLLVFVAACIGYAITGILARWQ
jgi:hypothetical protein